jgi:hypothetical protein
MLSEPGRHVRWDVPLAGVNRPDHSQQPFFGMLLRR